MSVIKLKRKYLEDKPSKTVKATGPSRGNPSEDPKLRKGNRIGMTPRRNWGRGEGRGAVRERP